MWWYILFAVNSGSKNLQSKDMCINMVIEQLKGLLSPFETYRENGFENAFMWNCFWNGCRAWVVKKNIENEVIKSPQESFRIDYFYFFIYCI